MVLLENIVLFHSSHRSISRRDTHWAWLPMSRWKNVSCETPLSVSQVFNTLCMGGGGGQSAHRPDPLLSAHLLPTAPVSSLQPNNKHQAAPTISCTSLPWAGHLTTPFSENTREKEWSSGNYYLLVFWISHST